MKTLPHRITVAVCFSVLEYCHVVGNEAYPAGGGVLMMGTDSKFIGGAVLNHAQLASNLANNGDGGVYLYRTIL